MELLFAFMLTIAAMGPCKNVVAIKQVVATNEWFIKRTESGPWVKVDQGYIIGLKCFVENVETV
jgi:hypothetical protein